MLFIIHLPQKGATNTACITMDQHIIQLCRDELITLDEAKRISRSKDLERKLRFG
jgi:twitching motility protein PilT